MAIMFKRTSDPGRRLARSCALGLTLTGAAALGLLVSACASSSGARVAQVASATTASASGSPSGDDSNSDDPTAYSACMRKHGVTNFPDPDGKGRIKITSGVGRNGRRTGVNVDSATFRTAQEACRKLLPNGGKPDPKEQAKALETMLKYSACMRSHGVPKFPDPQVSGGGMTMRIGRDMGVDPASPQFRAAEKACEKLLPGAAFSSSGPGGKTP